MPIRPQAELTPEAREHLANQGVDVTVSDAYGEQPYVSPFAAEPDGITDTSLFDAPEYVEPSTDPFDSVYAPSETPDTVKSGDIVDAEIVNDKPLINPDKPVKAKPSAGPPKLDEWLDFFSRIVLRFATEWYADYAFRGIDEDKVSEKDAARILMTKDERDSVAIPFAEYANKNKYMRSHGRSVLALADSMESLVILGTWFSRVNRIAKKYEPYRQRKQPKAKQVRLTREESNGHEHNGQSPQGGFVTGAVGGKLPEGYPIINPGSN